MSSNQSRILAVPTNIVTGFLGVGKTSAILHLLKSKPSHERWAVLVNEFGEIGVDGSLIKNQSGENKEIFISEVPGVCMCCAAGLPMQVALTQLLAKAKPDRLLIEPTGLGHPQEVLDILSSGHYRESLALEKTITLVDARKLSDTRYTSHDTFNQQIAVADVVVGNKLDLYEEDDVDNLIAYVKNNAKPEAHVFFSQYGRIELATLAGLSRQPSTPSDNSHEHNYVHTHNHDYKLNHDAEPLAVDVPFPDGGYLKAVNSGEGFYSIGWRFAVDKVFDHHKLYALLTGLQLERMKAVFKTNKGVYGYNLTSDALTEIHLDDCLESRIEMISDNVLDDLESQLLACLIA